MVAFKNGYFICVENAFNEEFIDFEEEFLMTYDFRTRPWYKIGENASSPVFTDVYTDMSGNASLACVTPYYDEGGNFAGVISISYGIGEIYKIVLDTAVGSDGFSFILKSAGNVILSTKKEGIKILSGICTNESKRLEFRKDYELRNSFSFGNGGTRKNS